ncbi:thioesterase [Streptomyces sp. NWU339]|uniref:thioesterase II family protein n=1 Tax=Streptomyces sp. NWU339 TaxID=2185284 RepID=UPI000D683ED2|nr:alpha/beta fold hydrolase [Streptomyces sp. NWU339]PWI07868.1 thioesterase [Streptomyces sp. NWU339]
MTTSPAPGPWLRNFSPAPGAPVRLVCLPHAGGSASFFFPAAQALAPRVEVLAVQYPGRQDRLREPAIGDIEVLAERIVDALGPWTDRPYALFGHSMGSIVGFETARRLQDAGRGPVELFVSGRRAPALDLDGDRQPVTDAEVIAEVRSLDGTGDALLDDEGTLRLILPALRSDYQAVRNYRYRSGPALECPITAFTGDRDPKAEVGQVRAWHQHTRSAFEVNVLPGGHFFLVDRAAEVWGRIEDRLAGATALHGAG